MRALLPRPAALAFLLAGGCGGEPVAHGLAERQANQVAVALDEAGIRAAVRRDEASEGAWRVEVPAGATAAARRLLAERALPRQEATGFAAVLGQGGLVPTPAEERARILHALSGELARSVEAVDGVVEARVHLAPAPEDPLRTGAAPAARAALLARVRAGHRARVEPLVAGLQALVAGAVPGLEPGQVAVVIAESAPPAPPAPPPARSTAALASSAVAATLGLALLAAAARRLGWRLPRMLVRRAP
ncbi:MAG: secretion protein [Deltaproteobacteria bacterium]|nr:secretion protein [Deltaproteobacteria bacterium]